MPAPTATRILYDEADAPADPYTSSSFTVTAGKPVTITVETAAATVSPTPTVTASSGMTCSQINTRETDSGTVRRRVTTFDAYPASSGSITLEVDTGGTSDNLMLSVDEWTDADTTDYVVQSATDVGNATGAIAVALTSPTAGNSVHGAFAINSNSGLTAGAGYVVLTDELNASPVTSFLVEYDDTNDATVDASIDGATARRWVGVAMEVKAAAAAAGAVVARAGTIGL
jgi:hypothetical protein